MRENGGPPWGPTESPIVRDLLRRIMPPDEPVNLSVGRSRAASMRRSIIPKLRDIHTMAGARPTGGYYDRAAPSGYVNQDQIILCSAAAFFPFLARMRGASLAIRGRARLWKYLSPFARNYRDQHIRGLYGARSRVPHDFGLHPVFDRRVSMASTRHIYYPRNDNRWITRV